MHLRCVFIFAVKGGWIFNLGIAQVQSQRGAPFQCTFERHNIRSRLVCLFSPYAPIRCNVTTPESSWIIQSSGCAVEIAVGGWLGVGLISK